MPIYKLNGEEYDINDDAVAKEFEKDNPSASVRVTGGGDTFEIPLSERDGFFNEIDGASYYSSQPHTQPTSTVDQTPVEQPQQTAQVQQPMNTSRLDPKYQLNEDGSVKPYNLLEQEKTVDDNGNTQWKPKLVKGADGTDVYRNAMTGEEYNPLSPEGMENVAQNTMDPHQYEDKTVDPSWGETFGKSLGAGFTRAGAGLVDVMSQLTSGMYVDSGDGYIRTQSYEERVKDKNNPLTKASDVMHATADRMSQEAQPYGGQKGFLDLLWDGEIGKFAQKGLATAGESLPMTLSAYNPYTMVLNAISMAGGNYRDETLENPEIPAWKRATYAVGQAAIEQAVEKYADPVFKYIGGSKGKEVAEDITKEATESIAKRIYNALGGLAKDAAGEGAEEVATNFGNDLLGSALDGLDVLTGGEEDYGLHAQWEKIKKDNPDANLSDFAMAKAKENVEAFIGGALAGAYTSGSAQLSSAALGYAVNHDSNEKVPDGVTLDPVTVEVAHAFDDGYKFEIPQDKNDAKIMYDVQRERMNGIVDEDTLNDIGNDPMAWIVENKGNLDADDMQTVLDYVNAKATYDGMIQKVRDDIDSQCAAFDKLIDSRTNRAGDNAGMLVPATMKKDDRQVFVIDGDIRMLEDGSMVDASKSSESILVCDAETGKVEFVSPHDVMNVGEAVNAEEEKARLREDTTRQIAQEQAQQMEGVLPFNAGDEYALVDDNGEKHTVKVIANSADPTNPEVALVSWDGGAPMPAPKEEIQKWSQQESRGRAEEKVAQKTAENAAANGAEVNGDALSQPEVEAVAQPVAPVTETAEGVQNTAENVINGGENVQQEDENVQSEPMPMIGEGDDAEPNFLATSPERGLSFLFGESQWDESDADDFLNSNVKASAKEVEKIEGKRPKAGTNFAKFNKDMASWNASKQEAEAKAKYWKQMKELRDAELAKQKAERDAAEKARQEAATDQAIAEEEAYAAEQAQKAAKQAELGSNNVAPAIREKWAAAPKTEGVADEIVLANGEKVAGKYYLVESGAASASHDANNGFVKTDGFPVDENGNSVNDRDYERDQDAQRVTRQIADNYDSRALQTPVVVSQDGVVLSGNGRTMAGELAASNNTDGAYVDYLKNYGQRWGFTSEQVGGMQHPRVVFVPDAAMPYTAETFAKFNQQEMKGQNKTEQAVKLGKVVDDATFGRIISLINKFDTLNEFYGDAAAATEAVTELQKAGVISEAQVTEMYDGDGISNIGRDLLENMLIGKAFESNPDAVRQISAFKSMRQTIIMALNEISNNVKLGEDFSLEEELAAAIDLVYKARKEGGYKDGEKVSGFARQMNLGFYGDEMTVADTNNVTALILADLINDKKTSLLRNTLSDYNAESADAAAGQMDLFSGGVRSKEDILKDLISRFNYGTEQAKTNTRTEIAPEAGTAQQVGTESQAGNGGSEESGLVGDYSLSDQTAANGEQFIQDADGNIDLVDIPQEVFDEIGYRKAPLRLTPSMLDHFISSHKKETKIDNREKAIEFILDVMNNFDHVRLGYDGALIFSIEDGRNTGKRAISVLISQASGDFYGIVSSGYEPVVRLQKRPLLWDGSAVITPTTDAASANVSTIDAQNSGEQSGSASNQSKSPNSEVNTLPAVGSSAITDTAGVAHGTTMGEAITNGNSPLDSQRKGSNNSATEQAQVDETDIFSQNEAETESADGNSSPVAAAIAAAEAETDTNPSEAQKEAGNYKKGHVKVDGYDITIENPKGSVRSGKDADGKEWSVTMNNTYGYIRGTEGVDGDHIDVFLSDNPEQGNVYVVDQVDADGNFDEHKVMYGFGSAEEARDNYLANYSEGWNMGTITEVSKEEFKKWIESSHRKTKPFIEYKSVKKDGAQGEAQHPSTAAEEGEELAMTPDEPKAEDKKPRTRKPSDAKTDEKIEDVGEKIEGARKDMVFNYAKKGDANGTKLSEIFPKPNFASMLKSGVSLDVLAEVKALYMLSKAFAKKKRTFQRNLQVVRMMGTAARYVLSKDAGIETDDMAKATYESVMGIVGKNGYTEAVRRVVDELGTDFLDVDFTDTPVPGMANFREDSNGYYVAPDGKTYVWTSIDTGTKFYYKEGSSTLFDTMDDAWKAYVEQVRKSHQTAETKPKHKMSVYFTPGVKNSYYIAVKINKDVIKLKGGFENSKDAFKYINDYSTELNAEIDRIADERRKGGERGESNVDIERKIRNIVERDRVGRDWRNGADVSEEDFMNTFGFRGVQFGNWASQKERQMHLNKAYDAFMDLSEVLGVSPKALGLGGELGFAFGARGRGTALAHYEPGSNVINLTKNRGAGCVAHEWFHALDFYLSKDMNPATTGRYKAETRDELKKVFDGIMKSIRGTEYYEFARKIDSTKDKPYWSEPTELGARAFEAYVKTRLAEKGQTDDYLSAFVANEEGAESTGEPGFYPVGDEMQKIGEAFQNVFDTMEERVGDDGKSYLFQIGAEEPGTDNVTPAQQLATEAIITALGENAGLDVVMESQEKGQRVAAEQNADTEMMALSNNEQEFDSMKKMAHDENGHVLPGLAEKTVAVVPLSEHGFAGTLVEAIKKAKEWAKSNLAGKEYDFPEGGKYVISNKAIGKYLSSSAFQKSDNSNVHLAALRMLPEIISNSMDAEIHEDYKKDEDGNRNADNGVDNEHKLVHRLYGAVTLGDKTYRVKTTMYEYRPGEYETNTPHSYEITEIELLDSPVLPAEATKNTNGISNNSISGANLLKNVEKSYDNGVKILENQQNTAEFMQVWHGSAAVFDHFDGAFMGSGEGSQVYGDGHYVTGVESTGRMYATIATENRQRSNTPIVRWKGQQVDFSSVNPLRLAHDVADSSRTIKEARDRAERYADMAEEDDMKTNWKLALDILKQSTKADFKPVPVNGNRQLYEVEIPDDDGSNYLDWNLTIKKSDRRRLADTVRNWPSDRLDTEHFGYKYKEGFDTLANVIENNQYAAQEILERLTQALKGGRKEASRLLSAAGFVGIKVPTGNRRGGDGRGTNYVIFNDGDLKITDRVQFMQRPEGTVYGWSEGNRIHLTPEGINPNTPIHEYTHLWARAVMQKNPKLWNRIKELLQGTPIWEEVVNDPAYQGLTSDDAIASEALSRLSGRKNAGKMEKMAQDLLNEAKGNGVFAEANAHTLILKMKQALKDFWKWVGTNLFDMTDVKNIDEVTDRVLYDMLNKTDLALSEDGDVATEFQVVTDEQVNTDIRFRERTEFDDGEVIDIVRDRGAQDYSLADSTMPSYKTKEELLHAFQEKHPAYAAVLTADGNGIEVTAWKSVLDERVRKPRRRNGEPTKAEKQRAAYMERKTQIAIANVNEKAQKLGLNVEVITDTESLPKDLADKKGWYNKVTGKITIVLPNHSNGQDVMRTLMHEGVAHHGLRQMFGKDFDTFLDNVYANASEEVRKRIAELAARKGWDFHVATEEYLAALAEDIDFERKVDQNWWQKVRNFFVDMLRKAGIVLDTELTDNDLRYIVWKSYERMAYAGEYGAIREARTVMMDQQLGTGNFGTRAVADGSQVADGSELLYRDGEDEAEDSAPLSLNESMIQGLINLAEKNKENAAYKTYVVKAIGGELAKLRKAMSAQKEYDRSTVEQLTGLARLLIKNGMFGNMSEQEMMKLLTTIKNATGRNDITKYAQQIYDLMIKNQLAQARNMLDQVTRIKDSKVNAQGVEVQGQLDVRGQKLIKAFRKAMSLDEANINELLQNASDRMDSPDAAVADEAATEYAALTLAMQYVHDIKDSVADERVAKEELAQARKDHAAKTDGLSAKAFKEYVQEAEDTIRQKQLERIEAFHNLAARLAGAMQGSIESAKKFRERELERVKNIHHFANSDMQGRPVNAHRVDNWKQKVMNNPFLRFLFNPLGTFDQMLRMIGNKSVNGEGYLYNHFMRGWLDATQKEFENYHAACKVLDDKASEVFGKKMRWSDLYSEERNMPKAQISFIDVDGSERTVELNQGNLLYIYMANKMADGRMKLRAMGIMEEDIENIKQVLDPRFVKLADWVQEEFLVNKRNDYNAVHERMFGAPMAAIENYFPLRILGDARVQQVDVAEDKIENELPSILTGSIIKRKTNRNPLDVMNTDAFSVVVEHLQQMEKWAAFAEWRRDLNTLLSYKRFRNQLKNMSSVYGAGNTLWRNFMIAGSIAAGTHRPKVDYDGVDTTLVNVAKGVTTAKIAFRVFTAIKQLLSAPAFMAESSLLNLGKSIATPWKAWNWAMEELPTFKKRWQSKQAGDSRLMKTDVDWRFWKNRLVDTLSRWGMSPNAFVDAMTVAIGGRAIYETKRARYIEDGYSEAEADKKAKQDAAVLVNQTQQSSETAFVSKMQLDRTVAAVSLSVFRNSSMAYQRQLVDSLRGLKRMATPGYKEESIDFMAKQMVRDGLDEDAAKRAATRAYNREWVRNLSRTALFGFGMQMAWNLGAYLPYLIFGDDDDEKKEMLEDAAMHGLFGSIEGLSGGNMISELGNMKVKGESFRNYDMDLLPLMSDIKNIYTKFESDEIAAVNDMVNLLIQSGFGVNPQTITDAIVSITDACNGDVETGREATILFLRLAQAPQSQIDKLYLDELGMRGKDASKLSVQDLAERYAQYKKNRNAPLTQWAYGDEQEKAVEDKYIKKFEKQAKEKMQSTGNIELDEAYEAYEEIYKEMDKTVKAMKQGDDEDLFGYAERMAKLTTDPNYRTYQIFKGMKKGIDQLMKQAVNAKTAEEKEGYLKKIDELKMRLVNRLDAEKQ